MSEDSGLVLSDDIDALATLTGINAKHLASMRRGELAPSDSHVWALQKYLDPEELELFRSHGVATVPTHRESLIKIPEGRELHSSMKAKHLVIGDWVSYRNPDDKKGTHWIEVVGIERNGHFVIINFEDMNQYGWFISTVPERSIRVARLEGTVSAVDDQNAQEPYGDVEII